MKYPKHTSDLYTFLEKSGVLNTGNENQIREAKRIYWLEYKKNWNKKKLQLYKPYTIHLNKKEQVIVTKAAKEVHMPITTFIKHIVLARNQTIVNPIAVGEIRELLILQYSFLQSLAEDEKLNARQAEQMLSRQVNLEKEVLGILQSKR